MGKIYESITPEISAWIREQHLFFVATAPLAATGHINTSPKGLDCLLLVHEKQVAYLDATGSGAETIAHLRENQRIVLMFCAFSAQPKIVRLHGQGRVITKTSPEWNDWYDRFRPISAPRSVIVIDVHRVSDSCGYGVPLMEFKADRDVLSRWAAIKGAAALPAYRAMKNTRSIDGLAALDITET